MLVQDLVKTSTIQQLLNSSTRKVVRGFWYYEGFGIRTLQLPTDSTAMADQSQVKDRHGQARPAQPHLFAFIPFSICIVSVAALTIEVPEVIIHNLL